MHMRGAQVLEMAMDLKAQRDGMLGIMDDQATRARAPHTHTHTHGSGTRYRMDDVLIHMYNENI